MLIYLASGLEKVGGDFVLITANERGHLQIVVYFRFEKIIPIDLFIRGIAKKITKTYGLKTFIGIQGVANIHFLLKYSLM